MKPFVVALGLGMALTLSSVASAQTAQKTALTLAGVNALATNSGMVR